MHWCLLSTVFLANKSCV